MMLFLEFTFSSPWIFIGMVILLSIPINAIRDIIISFIERNKTVINQTIQKDEMEE